MSKKGKDKAHKVETVNGRINLGLLDEADLRLLADGLEAWDKALDKTQEPSTDFKHTYARSLQLATRIKAGLSALEHEQQATHDRAIARGELVPA